MKIPVFRPFKEPLEVLLAGLLLASLVLVQPRIAESDAVQYFSYLPSLLIDGDLDFTNEYQRFYREDPEGRQGFKETFLERSTATGLKINFGPIGTALLWSPFYVATHAYCRVQEALGIAVAADGLSLPYRRAAALASAFYGAIGLLLSYRLARRFASAPVSFLAVVALWWGTPVAFYMYVAPGMSHAVSLFTVALFFSLWPWVTSTKQERESYTRWGIWGASAGLMGLVREQDLFYTLVAFIPALSPTLQTDILGRVKRLALFGAATILVFTPQLLVYQVLYGRPAPSPHVANKMGWLSPHFFDVLFSTAHGLFFWSPLILLFLAGGLLLLGKQRLAGWVLLLGFVSQVYISGAVDSWTQAGAFGSRRFVGATVVFAVWGAYLFDRLLPRIRTVGVAVLVALFVSWNVSLMIQFGLGIMDRQRLIWTQVIHNHVYEVPPRLVSVVGRYFTAPEELAGSGSQEP